MQFLNRGGVKLAYESYGSGAPLVVLIHGWCDSHTTLAALAEHFAARHHVIAVDLRGHGESDKPDTPYTIATFADDLAWMCAQLGLSRPIVVGHSLGGAVALELAARHPDLPAALVALEGVILYPPDMRAFGEALADMLRGDLWREAIGDYVDSGFLATDDPELRRMAHAELARLPQHMLASVAEQALRWDAAAAARACRVPALYVDAGSGLSDLEQFKALCPQLVIGKTVGVGHSQMVATPRQAAAMIDRFIADVGKNHVLLL